MYKYMCKDIHMYIHPPPPRVRLQAPVAHIWKYMAVLMQKGWSVIRYICMSICMCIYTHT